MSRNIVEITDVASFNLSDLVFSKPIVGSLPNTIPPISFKRLNISRKFPQGGVGDLIVCTPDSFSFGVSPNINPETQKVNGHVLSICLWSKNGATEEEKMLTTMLEKVIDRCKDYLIEHKDDDDMKLYELEMADMKKFAPLVWKKEMGKIVPGTGPTLYVKLIESKKQDKIMTQFYDIDGNDIDPNSLMGKYCQGKFAVKIESIFIGNKPTLQVKLYEAQVKLLETGMKRLLTGQVVPSSRPAPGKGFAPSNTIPNDETRSLKDDDDDIDDIPPKSLTIKPTPAVLPKKTVKRVKKDDDE